MTQHLNDQETLAALEDALIDIAADIGWEDALIYLAMMCPPDVSQPINQIRSELVRLRDEGYVREDRDARAHALQQDAREITHRLRNRLKS
jgi:hypothetical protein